MLRVLSAIVLALAVASTNASSVFDLKAAIKGAIGPELALLADKSTSVSDALAAVGTKLKALLGDAPRSERATPSGPPPDIPGAYYGFAPEFEGAVLLPGLTPSYGATVPSPAPVPSLLLNSRCFEAASVTARPSGTAGSFNIVFSASGMRNKTCDELFLVATASAFDVVTLDAVGDINTTVSAADTPAGAAEWVAREGVRVFRFYGNLVDTVYDLVETVSLFVPSLTEGPGLDKASMDRNRAFLQQYANFPTTDRKQIYGGFDESLIRTGDVLAIHRADGLATMEQFGSGDATSHMAVAMRMGAEQQLFVVESTDKTSYWPNPNIQKTAWDEWVQLSLACNYTVTLLRLRDDLREVWNETAVEEWIAYTMGYPYGYHNFLWTFQDVPMGNLPKPIDYHVIEPIFRVLEDVDNGITSRFVSLAMSFRLTGGQSPTTYSDLTSIYNAAAKANMTFGDLYSMPENDAWMYPDGPSMVCDVYACSIFAVAGLFRHYGIDDQINCTEFTNVGVYTLDFFNATVPESCAAADPGSPYCYIMGSYTIDLKGFNTVTPYAHMNERCSAQFPEFQRPPHC